MSSNEARRIVQNGLDRRKAARREAETNARMEAQDRELIGICNDNFVCSAVYRRADAAIEADRKLWEERRTTRMEAKEQRIEEAENLAVKLWGLICMVFIWLTTWTHLPVYMAVTLSLGSAFFLFAYLYRLHNPIGECEGVS